MANKPISTPLPADLPVNWTTGQTVSPGGTEVGLTAKHGYNYLSDQINDAQEAINTINDAFAELTTPESLQEGGYIQKSGLDTELSASSTNAVQNSAVTNTVTKSWGTFTLPVSGWTGSGPYTQAISVAGMKAIYNPAAVQVFTSAATVTSERSAMGKIYQISTADGSITATAYEKPTTAVKFMLLGV